MITGIYKILNLVNNKFYIGSSKDINRRFKDHLRLLRKNKSHSLILQRAFNKYGELNFKFEIIEECLIEQLFKREQYYVDKLKPQYNICIIDVSVPIGLSYNGYKDKDKYREYALLRLQENKNFGWKSRVILKLDDNGNTLKEYNSLKEYASEHSCAIGNVGKALKKGNKCKGFYIKYKN